MTVDDLVGFEKDIEYLYKLGKIQAPVHLRGSEDLAYETNLINIFKDNFASGDYVFGYWGQHIHALLCGIPKEELKQRILDGFSISLMFPKYNFYCSGIVGSLCGVATGVAYELKNSGSSSKVLHFCGDMASYTGAFKESIEYACNFDLPIKFIVEDNGVSVTTDTKKTWNYEDIWFKNSKYMSKIIYYKYINKYSHSGIQKKVAF